MTTDDYQQADALAEAAQKLAYRLGKLEDRPEPPPLPTTLEELRQRLRGKEIDR
jgi:hypothetical protein